MTRTRGAFLAYPWLVAYPDLPLVKYPYDLHDRYAVLSYRAPVYAVPDRYP